MGIITNDPQNDEQDPINSTYTSSDIDITGYQDDQLTFTPPPAFAPVLLPAFTTPAELYTHIYDEVVTAISDGDTDNMTQAINAALFEAAGFMSRFDYITIFAQTSTNRDPLLLWFIKDIAVWHFMVIANPNLDWEARESRYKAAIRWLDKVDNGRSNPPGWPLAVEVATSTQFHVISARKRSNRY